MAGRLKPQARRKLVVIVGSIVAGAAVTVALETAGLPAQLASTAGAVATALLTALDELRDTRSGRLPQRDVYRHPLLISFYVALAAFVAANLLVLPGAIVAYVTIMLRYGTATDWTVWETHITEAVSLVGGPLGFFYMIPIAIFAARRLRARPFLTISGALVALTLVGYAVVVVWNAGNPLAPTGESLLILTAAGLAPGLAGVAVGTWWARRTQRAFVMRQLFQRLPASEQEDLIDLARPQASVPPAIDLVGRPYGNATTSPVSG